MMSLTFGLFTQVSGSGPLGPLVTLYHNPQIPKSLARCWLVGCFGFNGLLRQYFSLYRAVSQREGEREEKG